MVSFLFFTAVAWILLPKESLEYWRGLGKGEVNTAGPVYVGNQGISGAMTRWFAEDRKTVVAALAIGFLVALIATAVAILPLGVPLSAYYFLSRETARRASAVLNILIFNFVVGGAACLDNDVALVIEPVGGSQRAGAMDKR